MTCFPVQVCLNNTSGQIIKTSAEVTLNGGLVRAILQNPLNSGLGIILIWPDTWKMCKTTTLLQPFANFFPRTTYHVHILSKNLNFKVKHFRKQTIGMTLGLFQPSTTFRGGSTDLSSKQNPAKTNPKSKDTVDGQNPAPVDR